MPLDARDRELYRRLAESGRVEIARLRQAIAKKESWHERGVARDLADILIEEGIAEEAVVRACLEGLEPGGHRTETLPGAPDRKRTELVSRRDLVPGAWVGDYRIVERIARGSTGDVYRAVEGLLGSEVALKVLGADGDRERYIREARFLASLQHPSIPRLLQFGMLSDAVYLVMDLVEGDSLEDLVKGRRIDWPDAVRAVGDAAEALDAAHRAGILHRDVRAGNILRTGDGRTFLVDFGTAAPAPGGTRRAQRHTRTRDLFGNVAYLAPEHLDGGLEAIDERTDLYALGVALFYAVTGVLPHPVATVADLGERFRAGHVPDPRKIDPRIPPGLASVLERAIALDPADRFASGAEFAAALEEALAAASKPRLRRGSSSRIVPAADPRSGRTSRSRRSSVRIEPARGRSPVLALAAVAGIALLACGILLGLLLAREPAARPPEPEPPGPAQAEATREPPSGEAPDGARPGAGNARAFFERSTELQRAGDLAGAIVAIDRSIELDSGHAEYLFTRGVLLRESKSLASALRDLDRALELDPENARFLHTRALVRHESGDERGAIADLDRAIAKSEDSGVYYILRGRCFHSLSEWGAAIRDLETALGLDPRDAGVWVDLGTARLEAGDPEGARTAFDRALERDPNLGLARNRRGILRVQMGDPSGGLEDLTRAIELEPTARNRANRGGAYYHAREYEKAVGDFDACLVEEPNDVDALRGRGMCFVQLGRKDEAIRDLNRLVAARPTAESYWHRCQARMKFGEYQAAIDDLTRALATDSQAPYHQSRAHCYEFLGKYEEALEDVRRAIDMAPGHWALWSDLARLSEKSGGRDQAAEALRKAIELAPEAERPALRARLASLGG